MKTFPKKTQGVKSFKRIVQVPSLISLVVVLLMEEGNKKYFPQFLQQSWTQKGKLLEI